MTIKLHPRRRWLLGAPIVLVLAVAAVFFGLGTSTRSAKAAFPSNNLFAYVVPTSSGPLRACSPDGSDCTLRNNGVREFIYVANGNRLTNPEQSAGSGFSRASFPNSFVVNSVDQTTSVNGVVIPDLGGFFAPPPDGNRGAAGRWPATVTCPASGSCNLVGSPAVVPGEATSVLWANWIHISTEPNGIYVFRFTVHGTLNGNPVDLTASSPPIKMTS